MKTIKHIHILRFGLEAGAVVSICACAMFALHGNTPRIAEGRPYGGGDASAAAAREAGGPMPERGRSAEAVVQGEFRANQAEGPELHRVAPGDTAKSEESVEEAQSAEGSMVECAPAEVVSVKASAYSHGARCNGVWAKRNALGSHLKTGDVSSASADWSRFPVGTRFRVVETGKVYEVDDYGSAMVGKDKVDLYMADYSQVDRWGVRRVTLEIVEWGSHRESLDILRKRSPSRGGYVGRMVKQLEAKLQNPEARLGRDEG